MLPALVQTVDGERGRWEKLRDEHSQRQRKSEASQWLRTRPISSSLLSSATS